MYRLLRKKDGWAISANQVGIPLRFFVFDLGKGMEVAINPILEFPDDLEENIFTYREGCLSIPNKFWAITRPNMVKCSYYNPKWELQEVAADSVPGRVFQHEVDHLDGKMLFGVMTDEQRMLALGELNSTSGPVTLHRTITEDIKR